MKHYLMVTFGVLCWAVINGLCIKGIDVPSAVLGTMMSVVGLLLFLPFFLVKRPQLTKRQIKFLLGLGIAAALNNSFFYAALKMGSVYNVVLIHYFASVLAIIWLVAIPIFKEKIDKMSGICIFLGIIGLIIMTGFKLEHKLWLYFALLSSLFYSLEIVFSRLVSSSDIDPKVSSFTKLGFQALIMPFIGIFLLKQSFIFDLAALPQVILAGIVLFISFILVFAGLKKVPAKHFAVLGYLDRIGAIVIAMVVFGERFGWNIWIGGGLILAAELPIIFLRKKA